MTTVPIYRIGRDGSELKPNSEVLPETFYVPAFRILLDGSPLPGDVVLDVQQVIYKDSVEKIDSFNFTLSNYDSQSRKPKYEPPSHKDYANLFDPGKEIRLFMGYAGARELMLTGQITTLEPDFPASGGLTLTVRGLNVLHQFRAEQHTYAWENKRDSDIAAEIGKRAPTRKRPGLGIEVRINPDADEKADEYVFMNNQYDIVFLMQRARRHNYEVVLHEEKKNGKEKRYLKFGPSGDTERPNYRLEWGKSLISFRPTLTTVNQVSEVVVIGWDRGRNRRIEESVNRKDLKPRPDRAERARLERLAEAFGNRREIITNEPVRNSREAKSRAKARLREIAKGMVKAEGETVGLPYLRAGRKVEITDVGERFSGMYYVTETTHTIGSGGYKTSFKARREEGIA